MQCFYSHYRTQNQDVGLHVWDDEKKIRQVIFANLARSLRFRKFAGANLE